MFCEVRVSKPAQAPKKNKPLDAPNLHRHQKKTLKFPGTMGPLLSSCWNFCFFCFFWCLSMFGASSGLFFFPRASERRVLPIVGVCISSSHLHILSSSHLLTSHLLTSHLLIFTSSHLHIFTSSHPHIFTHIFTYSHLLFLSLSLLFPLSFLSLLSLSLFSLSPSLSFSL